MAFGYPGMPNYYQPGSYYQPQPMPDQLAQLRQAAMQPVQQPPQTGMIWVQGTDRQTIERLLEMARKL